MSATRVEVNLNPGNMAPRYSSEIVQLELNKVVITESGMESGLPLLDFQCSDASGKQYFFMLSGRIANAIAATVKGVNERNHGTPEP